jgi:GntR family transcriptional repressor for pyruvate dehydrogenase complex
MPLATNLIVGTNLSDKDLFDKSQSTCQTKISLTSLTTVTVDGGVAGAANEEPALGAPGDQDAFADLIAAGRRSAPVKELGGTIEGREAAGRQPIAEQVAKRILSMIKSGNLKAGDRMPTEQQMGIAFGISRPPLREALKALTLMGVLESRQGRRYTVTDLSPSRLVAPFNSMMSFADYDLNDLFHSRALVDLELVRLCTLNAPLEHRQRIMKLAADGDALYGDPVAFRLMDLEFHQALNDGGGNRMLAAIAQGLYDVGLDGRRVASAMPGVIPKSVRQHYEVAAAVLDGDVDAAVSAYRRHLEHVLETTVQSMTATKAED